jgi:hypothetical protein
MNMKHIWNGIWALSLLVLFVACDKKDPKLEEALGIHQESMKILEEAKPIAAEVATIREQLKAKIQELEAAGNADSAQVAQLIDTSVMLKEAEDAVAEWEMNMPMVSGMGHAEEGEHKHAEGENHDHAAEPAITPDQALEIQKEAKANIEKIKADVAAALEKAKSVM